MILVRSQHHLLSFPLRAASTTDFSFRHLCLLSMTRFAATAGAAASANPAPFAVQEYLVASCNLTQAQALEASKALSHLKSPSNPDAVLAFLSGLGLSNADVAAVVARDPLLLCSQVDKTLAPRLSEMRQLGLSLPQIARLVLLNPVRFRACNIMPKIQYYLPLFGSFEKLLKVHEKNSYLFSSNIEKVVKPKVALLRECGLSACEIAKVLIAQPRLITSNPELVQTMVANAEEIGVRRGAPMFRHALVAVAFLSKEKIAAKVEFMKKTFGWSDAEAGVALSKLPMVLTYSPDRLCRMSEFLISEVGMEPKDIAYRPVVLSCSLEGRLMPRHHVVRFLKANRLIKCERSYLSAVLMREELFVERYIRRHMEAAPRLAEDYAAACRGEVPTGFILQEP